MPALTPALVAEPPSTESPSIETQTYSSYELLNQPWLPALTRTINEGFGTNGGNMNRLQTDTQLSEELGESGFTVIAYSPKPGEASSDIEIVGTASVKPWVNDGQWQPYIHDSIVGSDIGTRAESDGNLQDDPCDGDYEIALVTIRRGASYRKRGIVDRLLKACEEEIMRRLSANAADSRQTIRTMIKISKEINGPYWTKKGFTPVGQKICPKGIWGSLTEFTMWAMVRELPK